jgi:hypothetical protein
LRYGALQVSPTGELEVIPAPQTSSNWARGGRLRGVAGGIGEALFDPFGQLCGPSLAFGEIRFGKSAVRRWRRSG